MRAERPVDNWRIIPPPQREAPDGSPGATPKSRPVRSSPAEGSLGRIPRGPPSGTSHRSRRKRRPRYRDPGLGHWARRRAPPALLALLRRRALLAPTRVVRTSARYIPLAVSTAPSRCRQPPRSVNDPLTMPTTRVGAPRAFAPQPFRGRAGDGLTDHCWLPGRAARILESEEHAD